MKTEEAIGMFIDTVIDIHISKEALSHARASQIDDDSQELEEIIENILTELLVLIGKRQDLYDYIFSHSGFAPEDINEIEQNALEAYDEQTAKV